MSRRGNETWIKKFFSLTATVLLVASSLLVGISLTAPEASAIVTHDVGNLWIDQLSGFGRIFKGFTWNAQAQNIWDPMIGYGFMGVVIDQDNYDHTPGSENIADCYSTWPYVTVDDLTLADGITSSTMLVNNATTEKSFASFKNTGAGTLDPNDILINQTAWTVVNKDWAILQWTLYNTKGIDITNVSLGLELPLSHAAGPNYGVGGDSGDDIDGYDGTDDIYWVQDDNGTTIGFGSAIVSDPITHYYSVDYNTTYTWDQYKALYASDTWLYNRLHAPNGTVGATPGNRSSTVGWDGFTLSPGVPRTVTLVVAVNDTFDNMKNAIQDAQYYYHNFATGFLLTEFSDDSVTQQIEVYNSGREPTDMVAAGYELRCDGGATLLTGNWVPASIPTYGYSVFQVTGTPIDAEGDTIGLYQDTGGGPKLVDGPFAFGQEGTVPDPLDGDSVARHFSTGAVAYTNDWLQTHLGGATWGSQNNVGYRFPSGPVMLNHVMFNPIDIAESYIEVHYRGIPLSIANYTIVCDDPFTIPPGTPTLNAANPFFVLNYTQAPTLFDNMTPAGDNVYLYNSAGHLLDMVGWNSAHTPGYFVGRVPDATGLTQGFNDTTSAAAGWVFDQQPSMLITEIAADTVTTAQIEVYNSRGGDKKPDPGVWDLNCGAGTMTGTWSPDPIPAGEYAVFTQGGGANVNLEGDTFTLTFDSSVAVDSVGFGSQGPAPDPLTGESSGRYWDSGSNAYTGDWNRNASTGPTWGAQNDVPGMLSSAIVFQEVMFYPTNPAGHFIIIFNTDVAGINMVDWKIVSDTVYTLSDDFATFLLQGYYLYMFRYDTLGTSFTNMCDALDTPEDNLYMYDGQGRRVDMVGWNTAHFQGMSVKRDPMGGGTHDGYDDITSEAAGWVFDSPLDVILTEISDDGGSSQIELYNFWYPEIDFDGGGYAFENRTGATMTGPWNDSTAGAGEYAVLDVDPGFLSDQGDVVSFIQNGILIDEAGYGQYGTVPDPLDGESVQRIYDPGLLIDYEDIWERNTTSGPNWGVTNNVPDDNLTSPIILNEVNFNPLVPGDFFIEVYNKGGASVNISGWKIVGDTEYVIPMGTVVDLNERYFYLLAASGFFLPANFDRSGDNVYLYNDAGSIVDMVGWSSIHTIGETMSRVPEGNGTRDGYDDTSSIAAGWRFGQIPTVRLISVEHAKNPDGSKDDIKYGHFGSFVIFNLTISNFQTVGDTIDILNSSQEGWFVELLDAGGTVKIDDIFVNADGTVNITVNITLPDSIPFAIMDNITILIRSTNSTIIGDSITLNVRVYPFLNLTKSADPDLIYMNGTGHDEVTTITLNLTGMGAQVAVRRYLDVVFCIDSSGSMLGTDPANDRITESQNFVANYFESPDRGAVVDFDSVATLVPLGWPDGHHLSTNYPQIISNLNQIDSDGGTDVSNGLNLSNMEMAGYGQLTTKVPVIILLTDAQVGPPDDTESLAEADYAAAMGVIIMTIGLTVPVNGSSELLLKEIANRTGGIYYRAENAGFFTSIYENISSFLTDLAVWDNDTADNNPLVRDVLPPYIRLYGNGNFTGPYAPTLINENGPGGTTIIEWNLQWIKISETLTFTFEVVSNLPGYKLTNVVAESRASYTRWDNTTDIVYFPEVWITVLPPSPMPPALHINMSNDNDVYLWWDVPFIPGTEYYLIYRSTTPTGFDFSTPWLRTDIAPDPIDGVNPTRLSWNHTGASDPGNVLEWAEQWYYCIRAVNGLGETSYSSNTVGKWTRSFAAGNGTFSLPLEPETPKDTEWYAQDMNARLIKWIDPTNHWWIQHDYNEAGDNTAMEVGKGYEVDFTALTKYTFLGYPGAMIRYKTDSTVGFDPVTEADSLSASVNPAGDVTLNWAIPASIGLPGDEYYIYSATSRDGFHGTKGVDYMLLAINVWTLPTFTDIGAATEGTQLYYMVIPSNSSGAEGASTYSIGVWTTDLMDEYETIGVPLQLTSGDQTADWYCSNIGSAVGINYFMYTDLRWGWHSERMPGGAFDPVLVMTEGYQISISASTKYSFIGH